MWTPASLRNEHVRDAPFIVVGSIVRHAFDDPVGGRRIHRFDNGVQRCTIVVVVMTENVEDRIGNWFLAIVVPKRATNRGLGYGNPGISSSVSDEPESIDRRSIEGILRVRVVERVREIAPAAAEDVAVPPVVAVMCPFAHVTGHIERPEGTHPGSPASRSGSGRLDATSGKPPRRGACGRRARAVVRRRELLRCITWEGFCLVPAHASDRIISLPRRIVASLPRRRAGTPRAVD